MWNYLPFSLRSTIYPNQSKTLSREICGSLDFFSALFFFFFPDGFKVYCLFGSISGFCEEILRPLGYSGITHTQDQPIKASCVFDQWIFKDFHHHHDFWIFF